ncbi:hypothetical protein [Nocardioides lijunqiniae]|uniref:hypothetical protein n=1 Tax=Nocardioides lijunqiniae TaxID=2760832 RepID=UPI0018781791|nr:hypothetical protein [Nocardioides lijunqiniae]
MSEPTDPTGPTGPTGTTQPEESDWERRRRLEAVFGDALPDTTSDERDPAGRDDNDAWLRAQVPPHHGG